MSHGYKAVQWTPYKKVFDLTFGLLLFIYLAAFIAGSFVLAQEGEPGHPVQVLIRAFGSAAFILLTVILMIGPLARLSARFKPLLYNRRHLGVTCFLLGLVHAGLVLMWYHGFGDLNPLVSLFVSNPRYDSIAGFPFESLGFAALMVLFVMAATSHDFWNANLGAPVWKAIHMGVYVAYAALVAHVMLGVVQFEKAGVYPLLVGLSAAVVAGLHLGAGLREGARDAARAREVGHWIKIGPPERIAEKRAVIVVPPEGERIAVFRYDGKVSALSNACRHQNGPLGEGRVIDGCVTCPWHGFQYRPEDGASPPPFTERVATYRLKLEDGDLYVDPRPLRPGTRVEPIRLKGAEARA